MEAVTDTSSGADADKYEPPEDLGPPPDTEPPVWGEDANLEAIGVGEDRLTLTWTRADDPSGIAAYLVYQDDVLVTTLSADLQSLQINQLAPAATYTYRVEAEDTLGNTTTSGPTTSVATIDATAPSWPDDGQLTSDNITDDGMTLSWSKADENVGVTSYRIYQDNIEIAVVAGDITAYEVTGLSAGTSYVFRVEAEDAAGFISSGGPQLVVVTTDSVQPVWPEGAVIVASQITPTSCYLGWDAATDNVAVTGYQVLQDKVEIATLGGDITWLQVSDLNPWATYTFEVHALDGATNVSAEPLTVSVSTPDDQAPFWDEASALIASNPSITGVTLGWTAATDDVAVTYYRLYQDNVEVGSFDGATLSTDVTGLTTGAIYTFRVEAEDAAGNVSFGGPVLTVDLSDQTAPVWPVSAGLSVSNATPTSVTLTWTAATDNAAVAGYQVLESGQVVASVAGTVTTTMIAGLSPVTSYSFSVVASDTAGNATLSALTLDVTTPDFPAPAWPVDSTLTALNTTESTVTLAWSDIGEPVTTYEIYQDDVLVISVPAPGLSATVSGLAALTDYVFRVEAVGPTNKMSVNGPILSVTTADLAPPSWPSSATLVTSNLTESSLTLTWSALHDTVTLESYDVYEGGTLYATVQTPEHTLDVTGLSIGQSLNFKVEAVGPTGQSSSDGPSVALTIADQTAPTWGTSAVLSVDAVTADSATLFWSGASDNVAVIGYEVHVNGALTATASGATTTFEVTGLAPNTTYDFQVQAIDAANNVSLDGPAAQGTTAGGAAIVTDQHVFDALEPTCNTCHSPWFTSLSAFQTHVVNNTGVVSPGDPASSLLILYMEESVEDIFEQMPPVFFDAEGDSFMDMSDKGETSLTVQQIRDWIAGL
jgi:chitodextrinase